MRFIRAPKQAPAGAAKTAAPADVRFGKTFADDTGLVQSGAMTDKTGVTGIVTASVNAGQIVAPVPTGYYPAGAEVRSNEPDLVANNVRSGRVIAGLTGTLNVTPTGGLDTSDGTATAADILSPKVAYVNTERLTGTMANQGAVSITPSGTAGIPIAAGYHNGAGTVAQVIVPADKVMQGTTIAGVAGTLPQAPGGAATTATPGTNAGDLNVTGFPEGYYGPTSIITANDPGYDVTNIKQGASVFGKAGTYTSDATALAADILSTKTAYVNGAKVTGTMPQNVNGSYAASGTGAVAIPNGYHQGSSIPQVTVPAANVKAGTTIAGVAGTMADRGAVTINPSTGNQAIAAGYHNGSGVVTGDPDLVAGNIRSGANIFGVGGSASVVDTASYSGDASWILSGASFWGGGTKFNGAMPRRSGYQGIVGWTNNGDSIVEANLAYGYYDGGYQVSIQDTSLAGGNIVSGATIFGVAGSARRVASGYANPTQIYLNLGGISGTHDFLVIGGLSFTPSIILVSQDPNRITEIANEGYTQYGGAVAYNKYFKYAETPYQSGTQFYDYWVSANQSKFGVNLRGDGAAYHTDYGYVTYGGFRLYLYHQPSGNSLGRYWNNMYWMAIE